MSHDGLAEWEGAAALALQRGAGSARRGRVGGGEPSPAITAYFHLDPHLCRARGRAPHTKHKERFPSLRS